MDMENNELAGNNQAVSIECLFAVRVHFLRG